MKQFRIYIFALLVNISIVVVAQNDSILVVGRDTVAYRYTPMEATVPQIRKERKGLENFMRYVVESGSDQSFDKRVDMAFVPTIYYSNSTSLGLAVMATGLYRLDKQNRNIPASNFSVYATASIIGFYRVGINGNNIFKNDNQRIIYNAEFFSMPTLFWGVGYDAAMNNEAVRYLASRSIVEARFLQRVAKGLFVGVGADYNYHFGRFGGKRYVAEEEFTALLGGERVKYNATGISLFVEYDSRDIISNPQRGVYLAAEVKVRPKGMNSIGQTLWSVGLTANYYQRLWRGAVLAFDLRGEVNSEGTPWVYNATLGGAMRGYYAGRFNDLCAISLQAELRQQIFKRFGAVAWGGAGNVFHNFRTFAWSETLPTYGVGLRFELKKGVNLRLDYGFGLRDQRGKLIHGAVFAINEAF